MNSKEAMMALIRVGQTRGLKAKMAVLNEYPDIKPYLYACYNQYKQYYINPPARWYEISPGTEVFSVDTWQLLNALANRALSGVAAKLAIVSTLEKLEPYSQELLLRIIGKDIKIGVQATTINKVFPGLIPMFAVQLAKLYEPGRMPFPCIGTYKIDGLRCIYENGQFYSRYGRPFVGLEHIAELFKKYKVYRVDGEIIVPGKRFDDLSGEIRSFNKNMDAKYMVFDVHPRGPMSPMYTRQALADMICQDIHQPNVECVPYRTLQNEREMEGMYQMARDEGYEGLVLKREDALPHDGRNWDWCKVKPRETIDLTVVNVLPGEGKYENMAGALVCEYGDQLVRVGGGLSDQQRYQWFKDNNLIVGKTIEVEYMEISKDGKLRHPRLKCVRGDK